MIIRPLDTRSTRRRVLWRLGPGVLLLLCLLTGLTGGLIGTRLGLGGGGGGPAIAPLSGGLASAAKQARDVTVVVRAGGEQAGSGSGIIVSPDGLILTARHVANIAGTLTITLPGETTPRAAQRVATDTLTDIALLRLAEPPSSPLPVLGTGSSDSLVVGSAVALAGNPLGSYPGTIALGVLAGRGRDAAVAEDGALLEGLLQLDAAVVRGMSGGPLVDADGHLVGVVVAVTDPGGGRPFGFAVPIEVAMPLIAAVIERREPARCNLPYQVRPLEPDEAASMGLGRGPVMVISDPANAGVVVPGDVVVAIGGVRLSPDTSYAMALGRCSTDKELGLTVLRAGAEKPLSVMPLAQLLAQ